MGLLLGLPANPSCRQLPPAPALLMEENVVVVLCGCGWFPHPVHGGWHRVAFLIDLECYGPSCYMLAFSFPPSGVNSSGHFSQNRVLKTLYLCESQVPSLVVSSCFFGLRQQSVGGPLGSVQTFPRTVVFWNPLLLWFPLQSPVGLLKKRFLMNCLWCCVMCRTIGGCCFDGFTFWLLHTWPSLVSAPAFHVVLWFLCG